MALQAHHPEIYGTLRGTVRHIANSEGPTGFYKGIGPSLAQVIPYMGLSFHLHHRAKAILSVSCDEMYDFYQYRNGRRARAWWTSWPEALQAWPARP